jgi:hypothetical protein
MAREIPNFTQEAPGEAVENRGDEERILADRDETVSEKSHFQDLEEEPAAFIRGEVDVKSQMDKTAREIDASVRGHGDHSEDLHSNGLEEVMAKTDQDILEQIYKRRSEFDDNHKNR